MDQQPETDQQTRPSRRAVVSAGAVGLASVAGLTACGSSNTGTGATTLTNGNAMGSGMGAGTGTAGQGMATDPAATGQATDAAGQGMQQDANGMAGNAVTLPLKKVPKGGYTTVTGADGKPVIVARTKTGKVVAHSAVCTHQGCQVMAAGKKLSCPCHGAEFNPMTGAVLKGPADKPLPKVAAKVKGQTITVE